MSASGGEQERVKGHCPKCAAERWADVVADYRVWDEPENSPVWYQENYRILRCRGCDDVYFQKDTIFSEDEEYHTDQIMGEAVYSIPHKITYWPTPSKRAMPEWSKRLIAFDETLDHCFDELYTARNNELQVLTAIGVRTVFDRASELLEVDPGTTFTSKLEDLHKSGHIGASEKETLAALADAGGAAAHRGWKPSLEELDTLIDVLETFLLREFVTSSDIKTLQSRIPPRPKRTTKA